MNMEIGMEVIIKGWVSLDKPVNIVKNRVCFFLSQVICGWITVNALVTGYDEDKILT